MLRSLRNRLMVSNIPLSLDMARSSAADPSAASIELPLAEAAVKDDNRREIPPLNDWEAAVQCTFCSRWRPCSVTDAPKFTGSVPGFSCPLAGFSCLQEQQYSKDEIDASFA